MLTILLILKQKTNGWILKSLLKISNPITLVEVLEHQNSSSQSKFYGILISDKQEGNFSLEIEYIKSL